MQPARRRAHARTIFTSLSVASLGIIGCASPGPPKPPSLGIPRPVSDVTASRTGDRVALQFHLPSLSTDGLPLRDASLTGNLCRQMGITGKCVPVDAEQTRNPLPLSPARSTAPVIWIDTLPASLVSGPARVISYRIELRSGSGRSAGPSDPVYAAAGTAPPPVENLRAEPMRLGVALHWTPLPGAGEVLLDRLALVSSPTLPVAPAEDDSSSPPAGKASRRKGSRRKQAGKTGSRKPRSGPGTPGLQVLQAAPGDSSASYTVDATAAEGVPYTYSATRRHIVRLGGRTLELRSTSSTPVAATWHDIYPPAMPQGLTVLGYRVPDPAKAGEATDSPAFAVDLVWQPVNDNRLAGYRVYRQALDAGGGPAGTRERLVSALVTTPGFHDGTALAAGHYRYSVTAVDPKGNESAPALADVSPSK